VSSCRHTGLCIFILGWYHFWPYCINVFDFVQGTGIFERLLSYASFECFVFWWIYHIETDVRLVFYSLPRGPNIMSLHRGELNWQNSKILFLETSICSLLFNLWQLVHLLTHDYDSYWFTYCLCELLRKKWYFSWHTCCLMWWSGLTLCRGGWRNPWCLQTSISFSKYFLPSIMKHYFMYALWRQAESWMYMAHWDETTVGWHFRDSALPEHSSKCHCWRGGPINNH
jgi:hypothetical protein